MKIRKIISLLLCFTLILTLAACGNKSAVNTPTTNNVITDGPINYSAQIVRTHVYEGDISDITIIRSRKEIDDFINANKDTILFEQQEETISFSEALEKYDDSYFEEKILIMLYDEVGSGTPRHRIDSFTKTSEGKINIDITLLSTETVTDDMAYWFILIEPEAGFTVSSVDDFNVSYKTRIVSWDELEKYR